MEVKPGILGRLNGADRDAPRHNPINPAPDVERGRPGASYVRAVRSVKFKIKDDLTLAQVSRPPGEAWFGAAPAQTRVKGRTL